MGRWTWHGLREAWLNPIPPFGTCVWCSGKGTTRLPNIPGDIPCRLCSGAKTTSPTVKSAVRCTSCNGSGSHPALEFEDREDFRTTCFSCHGEGMHITRVPWNPPSRKHRLGAWLKLGDMEP